jgi:hypothetical protein
MLEIKEYNEDGLATLVNGGGWDVLMLNYLPRLAHGAVTNLHKHTETKESFVLLAGKAMLLTATGKALPEEISGVMLEPLTVYTVEAGAWHGTVMSEDAQILLVENADTTTDNTFRENLTDAQIAWVKQLGEGKF